MRSNIAGGVVVNVLLMMSSNSRQHSILQQQSCSQVAGSITVNVLLGILNVVCEEVREVVVQVLQQLQGAVDKEHCVIFSKQHPLVVVDANRLVGKERCHGSPACMTPLGQVASSTCSQFVHIFTDLLLVMHVNLLF